MVVIKWLLNFAIGVLSWLNCLLIADKRLGFVVLFDQWERHTFSVDIPYKVGTLSSSVSNQVKFILLR